jgi:RNA polymerase sigma factor (sigma-70 family)
MTVNEHLFRRESGRMVGALTRVLGLHNLDLAEDVVQEAFCRALETWSQRGPRANPQAWLMMTAKNCALDVLRRRRTAAGTVPELGTLLRSERTLAPMLDDLLSPGAVKDDQLRMMFSCCDPRLPEPAQVMLILHILSGLGVAEVASAFISSYVATEKRLVRAKKVLADAPGLFDVSAPEDVTVRLPGVQRALYLLFNEGYHGASAQSAVRPDLCREAMHLTAVLLQDTRAGTPASYALAALMSLHAARVPARRNAAGELLPLSEQDRSRWDQELIAEGIKLISLSAQGPQLSEYHLEAAIASVHAAAPSTADTDWTCIVSLYDQLLALRSSPVIALNRAIAVAQANGAEQGLRAIHLIKDVECLAAYPFYAAALGELELRCRRRNIALDHFTRALQLARSPAERRFIARKMEECGAGIERRSMDMYGEVAAGIDPL